VFYWTFQGDLFIRSTTVYRPSLSSPLYRKAPTRTQTSSRSGLHQIVARRVAGTPNGKRLKECIRLGRAR
jgi:hypothetical protein